MTAPAVRLEGVAHRYGATQALAGVTLELPEGAMIGLIGPDGVGKSTLLGLIAGVRRIGEGRVEVLGGDMAQARWRDRICARIAYMPQGLGGNLYPTLSVFENIDFFGRLYGQGAAERRWRIEELTRATGLHPFLDRAAAKLSGGMKQKLSLCCALIHDPDLLILDEPTTGVDPLSRKQFWDLIARIRARRPGMTVVTATAYMSEAETFEHLVAMDGGRVLATGAPEDLKARTGADTLEAAFVALLPRDGRAAPAGVARRPFVDRDGAPAIEAEGLTMRFGDFTAVDHVSFRIARGEIFGFLGSNGCGKTTTMKMLTGLLDPTEGEARLFGRKVEASDIETRRRVGYMSQSFSLYGELTVRANLDLHADLFGLTPARKRERVRELLTRFDLAEVADARPESLPLGVRQRLQLAVAVLHEPEMLILDEPTSGVDPAARDRFWSLLIELSRDDGVTIFISTHFMNEAERCDRISLMHAGRVLAQGPPDALRAARGAATLEEAFIEVLEEAAAADDAAAAEDAAPAGAPASAPVPVPGSAVRPAGGAGRGFSPARVWAFARREALELIRDPIRLAFAILGPLVLMTAMGFGISFDVEDLSYAALDEDRTPESRLFLEQLSGSRYFARKPPLTSIAQINPRMERGEIGLAIVIPPRFGRDLLSGRSPRIGMWLDGSDTSRAETSRGYAEGAFRDFIALLARTEIGAEPELSAADIETRFRYNQAFESRFAIPPGVLMMQLIMIPAMLTALGVVREKETGSISNLYAAPATRFEFLLGKQAPYILVAMISFATLVGLMLLLFGLTVRGDPATLILAALAYVASGTAFGLVISTFVTSQIAAIFASAIIVMIPTINFSGMLYPAATLTGGARIVGESFPPLYFQRISAGVFNKGLGMAELWPNIVALLGFTVLYWIAATLLLRKQEA